MSKILIDETVVRQALEALEEPHPGIRTSFTDAVKYREKVKQAITALRQALEQSVVRIDTSAERVEKEAENKHVRPQNCGTGYCSCIECLYEQPAPAQVPVAKTKSAGEQA